MSLEILYKKSFSCRYPEGTYEWAEERIDAIHQELERIEGLMVTSGRDERDRLSGVYQDYANELEFWEEYKYRLPNLNRRIK